MTRLGGRLPLLVVGVVLCGAVGACTAEEGTPPDDTAAELAAALTRGRLDADLFAGERRRAPHRAWPRVTAGMGDATVEVSVGDVTEDETGGSATADLTYAWDLPRSDETWEHTGTARLVEAEDGTWSVRLEAGLFGLRAEERLALGTTSAPRAGILGSGGAEIVRDRRVLRFGVDKAQVSTERQAEAVS